MKDFIPSQDFILIRPLRIEDYLNQQPSSELGNTMSVGEVISLPLNFQTKEVTEQVKTRVIIYSKPDPIDIISDKEGNIYHLVPVNSLRGSFSVEEDV